LVEDFIKPVFNIAYKKNILRYELVAYFACNLWLSQACTRCESYFDLGNNLMNHLAMDVSQAVLASLELEGQALVIHSEEVQDSGLQVVYVDLVLGHSKA